MNLPKAKECLERIAKTVDIFDMDDFRDATKVGEEAIERLENYRNGIDIPFDEPLPSETEE